MRVTWSGIARIQSLEQVDVHSIVDRRDESNCISRNKWNLKGQSLTWWCPVTTRHRFRSSRNWKSVTQTGIRSRTVFGRTWIPKCVYIIEERFVHSTFLAWKITALFFAFSFFINSSIDQIFKSFSFPPVPKCVRLKGLIRNRLISGPAFASIYSSKQAEFTNLFINNLTSDSRDSLRIRSIERHPFSEHVTNLSSPK